MYFYTILTSNTSISLVIRGMESFNCTYSPKNIKNSSMRTHAHTKTTYSCTLVGVTHNKLPALCGWTDHSRWALMPEWNASEYYLLQPDVPHIRWSTAHTPLQPCSVRSANKEILFFLGSHNVHACTCMCYYWSVPHKIWLRNARYVLLCLPGLCDLFFFDCLQYANRLEI